MDSDSESQDSDDGRRFRFEATRKDPITLSHTRRKDSPPRSRPPERRSRSRSRDRNFRDDRPRRPRDECRSRSSSDRDSNSRHSAKDRGSKAPKGASRDSKRRSRERDERESRHRAKEPRDHDSGKHKSKSRDKHKKRSRSRERVKEALPAEPEEEPRPKSAAKKQRPEDAEKVTDKCADRASAPAASNPVAVSDALNRAVAPAQEALRKKPKSFFDRVVNKHNNDEDASVYGPALPPALEKKLLNAREAEEAEEPSRTPERAEEPSRTPERAEEPSRTPERAEAPAPPPANDERVIGPTLPPGFGSSSKAEAESHSTSEENSDSEEEREKEDEGSFGPALPPHMERREVVGPMLPANFVPGDVNCKVESSKSDNDDDEYDDDVAGPLPPDHPAARGSYVQMQLEHRARQVEAKFRDKTSPEKNKREEWMTELPPAHAVALGLGSIPRKFKARDGPDMSDRSSWTDTPADRLRKQKEKEENRFIPEESKKVAKKSKHKETVEESEEKQESLLDMHLKTLKKKKKKLEKEAKELGLSTRRPFDRDVDLQTNRLDEARKKKIFEKASRLNDRFTSGKL